MEDYHADDPDVIRVAETHARYAEFWAEVEVRREKGQSEKEIGDWLQDIAHYCPDPDADDNAHVHHVRIQVGAQKAWRRLKGMRLLGESF